MKKMLKELTPPFLIKLLKPAPRYGWFGNYKSWDDAMKHCTGYKAEHIFEKVKQGVLKVQSGEAVYERDSVLFYNEEYNWRLLTCLLSASSKDGGILNVTDFGGSLGSTFYQNQAFLNFTCELRWSVVEQKHFVDYGQENIKSDNLFFYRTVGDCLLHQKPQVLVLSSVLQYLEQPFETISSLISYGFSYIFIDRTSFTRKLEHELTVQKTPPEIYNASYPAWFFNEDKFLEPFLSSYKLHLQFENDDYSNRENTLFKGFFLIKK